LSTQKLFQSSTAHDSSGPCEEALQSTQPASASKASFPFEEDKNRRKMSFQLGNRSYSIMCVPGLRFEEIEKETGTRGSLYVAWDSKSYKQCFLAQSVPPLLLMLGQICKKKFHSSSFYRIMRKETKKLSTGGFEIKKCCDILELNQELARFELIFVCSQDFEKWIVEEGSAPS
jgi:hypothetical protein